MIVLWAPLGCFAPIRLSFGYLWWSFMQVTMLNPCLRQIVKELYDWPPSVVDVTGSFVSVCGEG